MTLTQVTWVAVVVQAILTTLHQVAPSILSNQIHHQVKNGAPPVLILPQHNTNLWVTTRKREEEVVQPLSN